MINWWLIPALLVFIGIMFLARHDDVNPWSLSWDFLLFSVIVWPIGAIGLTWVAFDFINERRKK